MKLESLFKRSITYLTKDDEDLGDKVGEFGRQHEFADIIWYPSQRKVVYRLDDRAPSNATANGAYDFIPFQPTLSALLAAIRITGMHFLFIIINKKAQPVDLVTSSIDYLSINLHLHN